MPHIILATICLAVLSLQAAAQAPQPYQPLNLDTSCVWVLAYDDYQSGQHCPAEQTCIVEGDTMIGTQRYYKIVSYVSTRPYNSSGACGGRTTDYIREGTAQRRIYGADGRIRIDFNQQADDTMDIGLGDFNPKVDSVVVRTIAGVSRRVQTGKLITQNSHYVTVEGVGATANFPGWYGAFAEWQNPICRLVCFRHGGRTLYPDDTSQSCLRKAPLSVAGTSRQPVLTRESILLDQAGFRIPDPALLPLQAELYDISGNLLLRTIISDTRNVTIGQLPMQPLLLRLSNKQSAATVMIPAGL